MKEYNDFLDFDNFDNFDIEEDIPNKYLTIDEIIKFIHIHVNDKDKLIFAKLLDKNNIKWASGHNVINNDILSNIFCERNSFAIRREENNNNTIKYVLRYTNLEYNKYINFRK